MNNFSFNENKIKAVVNQLFAEATQDPNVHNTISLIHPQIHFRYNSLNICLGKQGSGKTTFMLTELIKLSELPDCIYDKIIYITNGSTEDITFNTLKKLVRIPIMGLNFMDATSELANWFASRDDKIHHTFVILEDASFLLMKDNPIWVDWVCKLRHLRMTLWINLHVWRSISTMIKTQITTLFIFKGYSKEQLQHMYRQSCVDADFKAVMYMYMLLQEHELLKLSNIDGKMMLIK